MANLIEEVNGKITRIDLALDFLTASGVALTVSGMTGTQVLWTLTDVGLRPTPLVLGLTVEEGAPSTSVVRSRQANQRL